MNLYLHDIETFRIARGDTLREPKLKQPDGSLQQFDMIVANPPFSLKNWGREGWAEDPYGRSTFGIPPAGYGDLAFVEHMVASMREGVGRLAVVMPHGVLFRGGAEKEIRKRLLENDLIEAVIGLPPNLFYNTSIPASILVCARTKAQERRQGVLVIDAAQRFRKGRNQNELTHDDVAAVLGAYRNAADPDGDGGLAVRLVPFDELAAQHFDLSIARYVSPGAEEAIEWSSALSRYAAAREALHAGERALAERLLRAGLHE
jgi:type I restriction enzyme M protein